MAKSSPPMPFIIGVDDADGCIRRDRRIDGIASVGEDRSAGLRGESMKSGRNAVALNGHGQISQTA